MIKGIRRLKALEKGHGNWTTHLYSPRYLSWKLFYKPSRSVMRTLDLIQKDC